MKNQKSNNQSRRRFIKSMGCAALGATTLLSGVTNLGLMNVAAAANMPLVPRPPGDYKALVCLSLEGGNDSFNMLVPRGTGEYQEYASVRTNQSLAQGSLLPINPLVGDGKQYGLHPNLSRVQSLFEQGDAAMVANVGALVRPTSMAEYNNEINLPLGLYSHADQVMHWQSSIPQSRSAIGWGGRMADILYQVNNNQNISMNISLNGTNIFQTGDTVAAYAINPDTGAVVIYNYEGDWTQATTKRAAIDGMLNQNYTNVLENTYRNMVRGATDNSLQFSSAIAGLSPFNTTFADTEISADLHMVAKTIAARNTLDMCRQTFFVQLGGFDNHDEVLMNHGYLMEEVDQAIGSFWDALGEMGLQDSVTLFTISDFARTLTSNGNGTDHGWGGVSMVVGGAVNGQRIYGSYPDLYLGNNLDTGDGRLIPTTSCDEYFAELALWFADNGLSTLSPTQLADILPNLSNFWSYAAGSGPIGFMS